MTTRWREEGGGVASLHPVRPLRKVLSSCPGCSRDLSEILRRSRAVGGHAPASSTPAFSAGASSISGCQSLGNPGGLPPERHSQAPQLCVTCGLRAPPRAERISRLPQMAPCTAGGRPSGATGPGGSRRWSQGDRPRRVARRPERNGLVSPCRPRLPLTHGV